MDDRDLGSRNLKTLRIEESALRDAVAYADSPGARNWLAVIEGLDASKPGGLARRFLPGAPHPYRDVRSGPTDLSDFRNAPANEISEIYVAEFLWAEFWETGFDESREAGSAQDVGVRIVEYANKVGTNILLSHQLSPRD